MSYENASWKYPSAKNGQVFSGGIVDNTPSQHLADNFSQFGRNFRLSGQSVINRPGYVLSNDLGGTGHPLGIGSYLRQNGDNRLIVRHNASTSQGLVSIDDEGTATNIYTSVSQQVLFETTVATGEANLTTKNNKIGENYEGFAGTVTGVRLYKKANTGTFTGTVTISLQADTVGSPSGASLASVTVTNVDYNALATGWNTFTFSSPYITSAATYWIVISTSTSDTSNHPNFGSSTPGGYTNSYGLKRNNTPDGWVTISAATQLSFVILDTGSTSAITGTERMQFTNIGDSLYMFDGTDMGKLDGNVYSNILTASGLSSTPPRFSAFFGSLQWVGGMSGDNSNKVYSSTNTVPGVFTGTGTASYSFPENVTGLTTSAQSLFVFTKNTISTTSFGDLISNASVLTYNFRTVQSTEGAVCNSSIVSVGAEVYYLTSSNKISKIALGASINGFEVIELSDRAYRGISTLMNTLDKDQSDSFAQYYPEQNLIKWHLKSSGSTINDVCVIYDVENDQFLIDTAKYFYDAAYLNGQVYTVSMVDTTVFKDEWGTDDDGGAINFVYWTKAFDEGEFTLKKCYWESRTDVMISPLAELTQEIYLNNYINVYGEYTGTLVDTKTVDVDNIDLLGGGIGTEMTGTFPVGTEGSTTITMYPTTILRTKGNLNTKGYSIAFRYSCAVVGGQVQLLRLGYKVEVLPHLATNLTI